jgi:hypothetical protein
MKNEILPPSMALKSSVPPNDVSKTEQSSTTSSIDSFDTSAIEKVRMESSDSKASDEDSMFFFFFLLLFHSDFSAGESGPNFLLVF